MIRAEKFSGPKLRNAYVLITLLTLFCVPNASLATLRPDEIAIIANARSPESARIAQHYASVRQIPGSRICWIDVEPSESLSRSEWESRVRPLLRQWMTQPHLDGKLRCLLTVRDVPLRIGRLEPGSLANREALLTADRTTRMHRLFEIVDRLHSLDPSRGSSSLDPPHKNADVQELSDAAQGELAHLHTRLAVVDSDRRDKLEDELLRAHAAIGGGQRLLQFLSQQEVRSGERGTQTQARVTLQTRLANLAEELDELLVSRESPERDREILTRIDETQGILASISWIDAQLQLVHKNESYASFDSELSLLLWPDHALFGWQPNALHYGLSESAAYRRYPTLMVARLDAPTVALAEALVDTALRIEASGLTGKVYLDARGKHGSSVYATYDQSIRDLARILEAHTELDVILDDDESLFEKGECPDASVYCGWYSLAKYVDAFEWNPGAVGYHIASSEAATLRRAGSQVWCKRMLDEGIAATVGPVHEPYLSAFPRPDEFFPILLTGKLTLVETFYRTKRFNSWVMVLIGDPLYTPFKQNPPLDASVLANPLRRLLADTNDGGR